MAFRGGPARRYHDPPLIKLVEEYLVQNKHRSFINLDDMGAVIRSRSFKYSRMKQTVFKEQLKKAYENYSTTATNAKEDFAGDNIEFDDTPLDDKMLKEMEGYPSSSSDEDSDSTEIVDTIAKDVGVNQMKNLYMTPSTASTTTLNSSSNKDKPENSVGTIKEDLVASIALASKTRPVTSGFCVIDSVSVSSSSDMSTKSDQPQTNAAGTPKTSPEKKKVNDEDSESDLEIIDEVQHDRQVSLTGTVTVSVRAPATSTPSPSLGHVAVSNQNQIQPAVTGRVIHTPRAQISNSAPTVPSSQVQNKLSKLQELTNKGNSVATNGPLSNASSRGVKRKPASKSGDEPETGINEDLTRKRPRKEVTVIRETGYKLKDFAGSEKVVEEVCKLVMHLKHSEIYQTLGVTPPRGFLLHGPPGTGKTLLANAIAGELEMPLLKVAGTELVSGISGESENNIRELFNQAVSIAPCIIFIDEIDSVTPRRENANKDMERRIVAQLLACIDDLVNKEKGDQVLLIGATNRIESIDTALRRAGRFDREICLGIPDEKSREKILSVICRNVKLNPDVTPKGLAKLTPGYVGADLQALVREAAVQAVNRKLFTEKVGNDKSSESNEEKMETDQATTVENSNSDSDHAKEVIADEIQNGELPSSLKWIKETASLTPEELNDLFVCMKDYEIALKTVQPSSKREGFATVPDTTWDDIGALHEIRDELQVSILGPVKHAEAFKRLGLNTPAGVLLCGPPGCGKTLLAKAVANEAGINFISVKGPELLNMYVGESERAVRQCFLRARNSSPCVIFFDELDALCPRRSEIADSGSGGRIVNQLLTEMDGIESRQGVFVMAATNRPDIIDPAVLRPGRLDKILFVNLPTPKDRFDILKALTKNSAKPSLSEDVNLEEIANSPECEDYTGADLAALVREASIAAFRELVLHPTEGPCSINDLKVSGRHFKTAFSKTKPSVGKEDRLKYKFMAEKYSSIR